MLYYEKKITLRISRNDRLKDSCNCWLDENIIADERRKIFSKQGKRFAEKGGDNDCKIHCVADRMVKRKRKEGVIVLGNLIMGWRFE